MSRVSFFSNKTLTSKSFNLLYEKLNLIDPKVSIIPILNKDGQSVDKEDLRMLASKMIEDKRYGHALEISQLMNDRNIEITRRDVVLHLNLTYKVLGLEKAEKYFDNLPKPLKQAQIYAALLNSYVKANSVDKAEGLAQEMKKLGFYNSSPFVYNKLINLYSQTGQHEKIDVVLREMESNGIRQNWFSLTNQLHAFSVQSDIDRMEKTLKQMEDDPNININWSSYSIMANGYIKVGSIDKGTEMLKKIEEMTINQKETEVLDHLLTLYTKVGKKEEIYRIWNLYKPTGNLQNTSYSKMIICLSKLDDIEGAEKIFEEWESNCSDFGFRVLNPLIIAYSKKGLLNRAETVVKNNLDKIIKTGKTPYPTWNILATGYLMDKQMEKAVEMMKNAMLVGKPGYQLNPVILNSCLRYLEEQKDVERAEEFVKIIADLGLLTDKIYGRLINTYIAAGKPVLDVIDRMKSMGFLPG